jgi:hypothetical protein
MRQKPARSTTDGDLQAVEQLVMQGERHCPSPASIAEVRQVGNISLQLRSRLAALFAGFTSETNAQIS